jgi:hypothetical protein
MTERKITCYGHANLPVYEGEDGTVTPANGTPEMARWRAQMLALRSRAGRLARERNKGKDGGAT